MSGLATDRATAYHAAIVPDFTQLADSNGRLLLMDPLTGHYPPPPRILELAVTPQLDAVPPVAWSAEGGPMLQVRAEFGFGLAPRPASATIDRRGAVGPFTITVTLGSPVNKQLVVPGFAYESIGLGCSGGFAGGYKIDARGIPVETENARDSDIYVTDPVEPAFSVWDRCTQGFRQPRLPKAQLFVPGGAISLPDGPATFSAVDAKWWRGRIGTSFDPAQLHGTLLWRTRDGRLMKTLQQGGGGEPVVGQTIMAAGDGTFPDNAWATATSVERPAPAEGLNALHYAATISNAGSYAFDQSTGPLTLISSYPAGASFPDRPPTVCLQYDPQVSPEPSETWSVLSDAASAETPPPALTPVGETGPDCRTLDNVHPGSYSIAVSLGAPVSRRVARRAVVYPTLVLSTRAERSAIRFADGRASYVDDPGASDLFLSANGVLNFPGGGMLLSNGAEPSLRLPHVARTGNTFSETIPDTWQNDRVTLDGDDWRAASEPCLMTRADGSQFFETRCDVGSADTLLFRTRDGRRYVKLRIVDFYGGSLGGGYAVTDARARFTDW